MSERARHRAIASAPPRRAGGRGWIAALLAALALVIWDAAGQVRHYARASAAYGVAVRAPAADAASPTGWADGRRTMVYPGNWVDAQHWIVHTQHALASGDWRLRHVDEDNAPDGRPVHWAAPYRVLLGACAWAEHLFAGEPLGRAAERGALFANPALLGALILGLSIWVARRWGGGAAALLALGMAGTPSFSAAFAADNMDHHGLIHATALVSLIGVLVGGSGWVRNEGASVPAGWSWLPGAAAARRAFVVAGVAGGCGMWVSAAGTIPLIAATALGALGSAWLGRNAPNFVRFDPGLWRRWGISGGITAAACYLVEYFPAHLGWRLEVNHPLYALAWMGAGEVLAQLTAAASRAGAAAGRGRWLRLIAGGVALLAPAVVLAGCGARVFAVADPFLWALSHDYTPEFQSFARALQRSGWDATTIASCLPMLLVPMTVGWMSWRGTTGLARAVVAVPLAGAALFWLMAMKELRWWVVGYVPLLGLVSALGVLISRTGLKRTQRLACWATGAALFGPGLAIAIQSAARHGPLVADDYYSLVERDLAHQLRQRVGDEPWVVLSGPATTSRLIYFASARGLGTPYWENLDGMKRAAEIFAAKTADEARELIAAAGVTHIVLLSWDNFVEPYVRLARGLRPTDRIDEPAFGSELTRAAEPPPWLRRLPDHLPQLPLFEKESVLLYEVTDRTRPEQVAVRTVRDLLYRGQLAAAKALMPRLAEHADDLAAQVALARVQFAGGDAAGSAATLDRIASLRERRAELEPEDRVDMIAIFMLGGRTEEARRELGEALRVFDAGAVRRLTPGSLKTLLGLARRLGVAWPDPSLEALAAELLPPDGRI